MPHEQSQNYILAKDLTLEQWLVYVEMPEEDRPALVECFRFPTDALFQEYIDDIVNRSEKQIKTLLRNFLPMGGNLGIDQRRIQDVYEQTNLDELYEKYEHVRRLVEGYAGKKGMCGEDYVGYSTYCQISHWKPLRQ